MRYQRDHNAVGTSGMMRSGQVIPLRSIRETFNQLSVDPRGRTGQSDEAVVSHGDSGAGPSQAPLRAGLTDTIKTSGNICVSGNEHTHSSDECVGVALPYTFKRRTYMNVQRHVHSYSECPREHTLGAMKF